MRVRWSWVSSAALVALTGCSVLVDGDYTGGADAGLDAGPIDASLDSGRVDSGPTDAGPVDSGPMDSGPVDSGPVDSGPPTLEERCREEYGEVTVLRSVEDLRRVLPRVFSTETVSSERTVTGTLRWDSDMLLVLDSDTAALPENPECDPDYCRMSWQLRGSVLGVSVHSSPHYQLRVQRGAEFRLRFGIFMGGPVPPRAVVEVEPACEIPCTESQALCDADLACYAAGPLSCLECAGRPGPVCACESLGEGESCSYVDGDVGILGTCTSGVCERT